VIGDGKFNCKAARLTRRLLRPRLFVGPGGKAELDHQPGTIAILEDVRQLRNACLALAVRISAHGGNTMIKLLVERDRPPTFNLADDREVARHARISVNAIAELAGRYHWLCTYATQEKLFSVIVVDDETAYDAWVRKTNAYTAGLKVRRIVRVLDPSLAE
jgi:hypothetical protein